MLATTQKSDFLWEEGTVLKGHKGTICSDGNVINLDVGHGYMEVCKCKN